MINIFQPCLGNEELDALKRVFESNWIGKGGLVTEFEEAFSTSLKMESKSFCSTNSCTEGLFLAGDLYQFGPADEVIVPSISFVAVGSSVVAKGARLVLCDADSRTLNTTAELIEQKISSKTKAVILNHYGGVPCDMEPILALCRERGIAVIEDSACAPRSFYKGRAVGTLGDMGTWSFDAMKIVCTGDGGMIYLRDPAQMMRAKEQLYLGLPVKQTSGLDSAGAGSQNWWEFEINRPGRRAIMNNIAGAIGLEQMKKLPAFIGRRKKAHERYVQELGELGWLELPPRLKDDIVSSYYFFWIQSEHRDELARYLKERDIYTTFRYWPLHRISYFGQKDADLRGTEEALQRTLNIPMHQSLSDDDVEQVIDAIKEFGRSKGL